MDNTVIILGAAAFLVLVVSRLASRPNREFWRYYREILNSSKYKVKGHFEE